MTSCPATSSAGISVRRGLSKMASPKASRISSGLGVRPLAGCSRSSRGDSFAPQDAPHVFLGPFKDGPDLLQGRFQVYADQRLVVFLQVLDVGFRALGDDVEGL